MIIQRWGLLGLDAHYETPSPDIGPQKNRAYHARWMAAYKWHHALRRWLFGGEGPLFAWPTLNMEGTLSADLVATGSEGYLLVVASCGQFQSLAGVLVMAQLVAQGPEVG